MKRTSLLFSAILLIGMLFSTQVMAQGRINLNAAKTTQECRNIKMDGFSASFSYNSIESREENTEKGVFSIITMGNSVAAGNIGEPQVPVTRELIAVPFGATPVVNVKSYTVEEYNLADYGIQRLYPQQASVSKSDKNPKFAYNEAAYAAKGFDEERPIAEVTVMGTMRGIQLGALQLNTLRYNASTNTVRVYNNVEVEVEFKNADLALTEQTLVNTYSPYFRTVYSSLFNERAILDVYDDHPDLWTVPVKVLVVANRMFEETIQPWITWKTEKGFILDVNYTDEIGTSAAAIKTFIHNKYNEGVAEGNAPSFLIIFGDNGQVPASQTGSASHCVTDLYYYTTDNDVFGDMYHSRFTAENVTEMQTMVNKSLMYEQYTMPDPSYLSNVLLIAGWDATWNPKDGKPTIQYAMNYYYNAEHGFANVYNFLEQPYNNPYASLNTGVGFVNYTAHGGNTSWSDPQFTNSDINALTNQDKYFWAMGNCCQAADWGISGKCFGETFVIAPNKGAFAYIGSCPSTYWYEDYYFAVGATNTFYAMPTYEETSMGCYDSHWQDDFNSLSAVPFVGNVAVAYSHANGYTGSVNDQYYWESYHVLGDGSICPYHTNPIENTVSHMPTLPIGVDFYTVTADPGSYVGITKDGVLYGAGEIGEEGTADIPLTPITSGGNVKIVVTHPQRQPYIAEVPAAALTGAYVAVDSYALNAEQANYGETVGMDITLKNVGTLSANNITAILTTENEYVTIISAEGAVASLAPDQTAVMEGFQFEVAENVPDKTKAQFVLDVTDGTDVWSANINVVLHAPVLAIGNIEKDEEKVTFTFNNTGSAPFYGGTLNIFSSSSAVTFAETTINFEDTVDGGESISVEAPYTIDPSVEEGSTFEIAYSMTTGLLSVEGNFILTYGAIMEGFESGAFSNDWTFSAQYPWTIAPGGYDGSSYCAMSGNKNVSNSTSYMELTVNVPAAGDLTFYYKVSTESNWDKCYFYMDGQQQAMWSGNIDWTMFTQPVTTGTHTFKWSYEKDGSVNSGDDCVLIDDIHFPPVHVYSFLEPVTNLEAVVNDCEVTLSWESSERATEFIIMRDGEEIERVSENSYTDRVDYGTYEYSIIATNSEGILSAPTTIVVEVVDVNDVAENTMSLRIYPNPVSSTLYISSNADFTYALFNNMGQEVVRGNAQGSQRINVNDMPKGIYFLRITSGSKTNVQKIIVK